ncbi:MAG: hypothetical protein ACT4OM_06170 [Actinomycetota bacterium]
MELAYRLRPSNVMAMDQMCRTPEELQTVLEDTLLLGDRHQLGKLFEYWAVLAMEGKPPELRGRPNVTGAISCSAEFRTNLAEPWTVVQSRNRALVFSRDGTNLVRRDREGAWRYEILFLRNTGKERQ